MIRFILGEAASSGPVGLAQAPSWISCRSLQFRWKLGEQILDLFGVPAVADQKRVAVTHDDEIMHAEERDGRLLLAKNDVVARL
jgi:hypothetical protein